MGNSLDRWCQRSIDKLSVLEGRVIALFENNRQSRSKHLYRGLEILLSRDLRDLEIRSQIRDNIYLITDLMCQTRSYFASDGVPQVESQLLDLEKRLIDLKDRFYKFEKCAEGLVSLESPIDQIRDLGKAMSDLFIGQALSDLIWEGESNPEIVTGQLRDLQKGLFDIKEVASSIDWDSLQKVRDLKISEELPQLYDPFFSPWF